MIAAAIIVSAPFWAIVGLMVYYQQRDDNNKRNKSKANP
jgi:hypothetical protein